jgi:hypothetical protein
MPDSTPPQPLPDHGLSPREVGRYIRKGRESVLGMIKKNELGAIVSYRADGSPRYIVLPEHLSEWVRKNAVPAPRPARRRNRSQQVDYFPD